MRHIHINNIGLCSESKHMLITDLCSEIVQYYLTHLVIALVCDLRLYRFITEVYVLKGYTLTNNVG